MSDALGRPLLAEGMKRQIDAAFAEVPAGKRGAVLVMANEHGATAHLAAKLGDHWKVAAGGGVPWKGEKPSGWIGIAGAW